LKTTQRDKEKKISTQKKNQLNYNNRKKQPLAEIQPHHKVRTLPFDN